MMRMTSARRLLPILAVLMLGAVLGGCGGRLTDLPGERDGPGEHRDTSHVPDAVPRVEPISRGGNPETYVVLGKRYHTLSSSRGHVERGIASWYGRKFHGRRTSNGEVYDMYTMSAAHRTLPIPTYLEVTNLENGKRVIVRVNDRGPFHENRIIDLSYAAAARIGMLGKGTALVEIRAIEPGAPKPATIRVARKDTPAAPAGRPGGDDSGAPRIYLQAGAFSSDANARRLRTRLEQALSRQVRVIAAATAAGAMHRVQVGPLNSVEVADQVTLQMHQLGIAEPLVVID